MLDHYLKEICKITSHYGILFTIETVSPKSNHTTHQIQTDDIDMEFSKVFTDYIKNIQRANSIFTTKIFQLSVAIYLY